VTLSTSALDQEALLRCADEPIAVPGAIQPHGVLLAATEPDLAVVVASANAAELFGRDVVGHALPDLLADDDAARLRAALAGDLAEVNPVRVVLDGGDVDLVLHRADGLLMTEWEPIAGAEQADAAGTAACPQCCSVSPPPPPSTTSRRRWPATSARSPASTA
jgi:chemotaxis family two-component system sensor kinase Cph1